MNTPDWEQNLRKVASGKTLSSGKVLPWDLTSLVICKCYVVSHNLTSSFVCFSMQHAGFHNNYCWYFCLYYPVAVALVFAVRYFTDVYHIPFSFVTDLCYCIDKCLSLLRIFDTFHCHFLFTAGVIWHCLSNFPVSSLVFLLNNNVIGVFAFVYYPYLCYILLCCH